MKASRKITNADEIITTHDIAERIEWIELDYTDDEGEVAPRDQWSDPDDRAEHHALTQIMGALGDHLPYRDPVILVREDHFEQYVQDDMRDGGTGVFLPIWEGGYIKGYRGATWHDLSDMPGFRSIDWKTEAAYWRPDYDELEWGGVTYLYEDQS